VCHEHYSKTVTGVSLFATLTSQSPLSTRFIRSFQSFERCLLMISLTRDGTIAKTVTYGASTTKVTMSGRVKPIRLFLYIVGDDDCFC
jgi:hypothetical protein